MEGTDFIEINEHCERPEVIMTQETKSRYGRLILSSSGIAVFYTILFFAITNFWYWYFNRQFLYGELFGDAGYYMYDWLPNTVATITMFICFGGFELMRGLLRFRNAARA